MTIPGTGRPKWFENPPQSATVPSNRPSWAITCPRCDHWWTGLGAAHCGACHETFTGVGGFDMHRRGGKCSNPADVGLIPADKPWRGWSRIGTWSGPDD